MAMRGALHFPKLQHNWSLTITSFNVISWTLFGGGVPPLYREAVGVFYSHSRLGYQNEKVWDSIDCWKVDSIWSDIRETKKKKKKKTKKKKTRWLLWIRVSFLDRVINVGVWSWSFNTMLSEIVSSFVLEERLFTNQERVCIRGRFFRAYGGIWKRIYDGEPLNDYQIITAKIIVYSSGSWTKNINLNLA